MNEDTIPILPCRSSTRRWTSTVSSASRLPTEKRPNTYAVVERGGVGLHFFVLRGAEAASS